MTGTEIYQNFFGIDRLTLNEQGEQIREHTALATNPYRNDYQEERLQELTARIAKANVGALAAPVKREI